jgi:peptide deformylase
MIIKSATQVGNPIIRKKSKKVTDVKSAQNKKIIRNLVDSMRHHDLVGMAAPQIGQNFRIFVTEIRETKFRKKDKKSDVDGLRVFVNPKIVSFSDTEVTIWEGCGSVAESNLFGKVTRPESLVIEALNEKEIKFTLEAKGLLARVIQHEMDHIDGIVFTDKADSKTYMSRNEYFKMKAAM